MTPRCGLSGLQPLIVSWLHTSAHYHHHFMPGRLPSSPSYLEFCPPAFPSSRVASVRHTFLSSSLSACVTLLNHLHWLLIAFLTESKSLATSTHVPLLQPRDSVFPAGLARLCVLSSHRPLLRQFLPPDRPPAHFLSPQPFPLYRPSAELLTPPSLLWLSPPSFTGIPGRVARTRTIPYSHTYLFVDLELF